MKRTISVMVGKGSVSHNSRKFHAKNTDPERSCFNVEYCNQDIREVYHELFDEALAEYNAKQNRSDRRIENYYEKILAGKQEKPFHEVILQVGNREDMGAKTENGQLAKQVLDDYMKSFQSRNPTLKVFAAHLHMDESSPHLHIDFVPFVTGSKRGLETRVSLKQALSALGFKGGTRSNTEWNQWVAAEKEQLAGVMQTYGIEWEKKGTHEKHLSVLEFEKREREKEVAKLEGQKEELKAENQVFKEVNKTLQEQLTGTKGEIHVLQKKIEQSREEAVGAKKLAEDYQNRVKELVPIVENMEDLVRKFPDDPEQLLPEAGMIESGKAYREKKAKPQIEKMVKIIRSVYAEYLGVSRKFEELQESYCWEIKEEKRLSGKLREIYMENTALKKIVKDFAYVKAVLGNEEVCAIVQQERLREQGLRREGQNKREKYSGRER